MMKSVLRTLVAVLAVVVLAQNADAQMRQCGECHKNVAPGAERLTTHTKDATCLTCHHIGLSNDPKKVAALRQDACKGCHKDVAPTHTRGKAGQPACETCHSIHQDKPLEIASVPAERCNSCHEKPHVLHSAGETDCSSCHKLHGGKPLRATDPAVSKQCVSCHKDAHPSHATLAAKYPACTRCHSLASDEKTAAVPHGAALTGQCTSCHRNLQPAHVGVKQQPQCADCHDFDRDQKFPAAAVAVSKRCAGCHEKAYESYIGGGHAKGMQGRPNPDLPNCVSCHKTHTGKAGTAAVRVSATSQCVACHSDEKLIEKYDLPRYAVASYKKDYHGATNVFNARHPQGEGQPAVMTCSDCHGAHAVGWSNDKLVADVCVDCHNKADVKLAGAWLGHGKPGPTNQLAIWAVRLFYWFLVPFMLLGLTVLIAFQYIDQKRRGATVRGTLKKRFGAEAKRLPRVQRFTVRERFEHFGSMATFIILGVTGLPQARPNLEIAQKIIAFFGGVGATRFIHRVAGFIFVGLMVTHVATAILRALRKRRLPVMAPTTQDFVDAFGTLRHFLWGTPRPRTGKFDFAEKFEYWGLFLGGMVMSVTGIVLVWPDLVSQLVPGIIIAMLRTVHGLEATFAVLVVVLWHSWGVMLRPEVFPLDTSIFTGKIDVHRLEEEHGREYDELVAAGVIEAETEAAEEAEEELVAV